MIERGATWKYDIQAEIAYCETGTTESPILPVYAAGKRVGAGESMVLFLKVDGKGIFSISMDKAYESLDKKKEIEALIAKEK